VGSSILWRTRRWNASRTEGLRRVSQQCARDGTGPSGDGIPIPKVAQRRFDVLEHPFSIRFRTLCRIAALPEYGHGLFHLGGNVHTKGAALLARSTFRIVGRLGLQCAVCRPHLVGQVSLSHLDQANDPARL
jgi:hypothetical protein